LQCVAGVLAVAVLGMAVMMAFLYCGVFRCVAVCCSVLQCVAVRCDVLQCAVVCYSVL